MRTTFTRFSTYFLVLFLSLATQSVICAQAPAVENGVIDLRNTDLTTTRVPLTGNWYYFENQLITPDTYSTGKSTNIDFPKTWNDHKRPGIGYATYAVQLLLPTDVKSLAVEIPQLYSSYSLWVNDKLIARNGKVGTTEAESIPQWNPQTVSFDNPGASATIILQISNFHHYKGGAKDPIYIGSSELLNHNRSIAVVSNLVESITLGAIALIFFVTYFLAGRKRVIIYFALLGLTWSIRVGFSNIYVFISYMPDFDWNLMVRIEYITLFLTMIFGILFISRIFVKEETKLLKYLLVGGNAFFIAFTVLAPATYFTQYLPVYLSFCAILLIYCIITTLQAWINQRAGSSFLTFSILLGACIFSYDVFSYGGYFSYSPLILSIGYISVFSLMSVALMLHLTIIKSRMQSISMLTYKDLYD